MQGAPGVDQIAQGMGGLMSITGLPGQGPVRVGIPIADLTAGILLAHGIMLALFERERTGEGQWVHTSLLEAQIFMLDFQASRWLMEGEVAKQAGNDHPTGVPTGVFPTSRRPHQHRRRGRRPVGALLRRRSATPELADQPGVRDRQLRSKNRKALNERIADDHAASKPSAHWVEAARTRPACRAARSTRSTRCSPIRRCSTSASRGRSASRARRIKVVGQPINMSRSAAGKPCAHARARASTPTRY